MIWPPVRFGHRLTSPGTYARRRWTSACPGLCPKIRQVPALGGRTSPQQNPQCGGFPGPVRAEETVDLSRVHREVEPVEGPDVSEILGETADLDDRRHEIYGTPIRRARSGDVCLS